MTDQLTRRDALKTAAAAGAGWMLATSLPTMAAIPWAEASKAAKPSRGGGLRFAHLTDMHVQPERRAGDGYAAALQSLQKLDPKPQFVITGGDHVMDATEKSPERCIVQWDLYQKVLRENCSLPVHATMGNHDVAGWGAKEKFVPNVAGYGKAMAYQRLSLKNSSYSFDAGDWRFIILDSITQRGEGYFGSLGDEQMHWLTEELARAGKDRPICITSHLPIMSVAAFFDGERLSDKVNSFDIPDSYVHRDMGPIVKLIEAYNVRLLLSGHIHLLDRCDYRGKTYICDGAVSGNWWKGSYHDCPEGYGVIDIWPDGSFEHQYVTYGWKAEPAENEK